MQRTLCLPLGLVMFVNILTACACGGSQQPQTPAVGASATQSVADASRGFTAEGCARTGCSGQLCKAAGETVISTCVWREEYACYKTARCEKQADGQCGWTPSQELNSCISAAKTKQ